MAFAGKLLGPVTCYTPGRPCIVAGSFKGNGAGNPVDISIKGVTGVTRTGAGVYTFQVPGNPKDTDVIFAQAALNGATPRLCNISVSSTGLCTVKVFTPPASAVDAASGDRVEIFLFCRTSQVR